MLLRPCLAAAVLAALSSPAAADPPRTVADIAPVHSLAARVMEGVGEPALLIPPGASPHEHALRPSEAAALQSAELVLRVGDALTPGLGARIATLSGARVLILADAPGTDALPLREDHDDDHEHGHEGAVDPHLWLDPANAAAWTDAIAAALAEADPENAERYAANAAAARGELAALAEEVAATLAPVRGRPVIVFHDAYRYFERAFGLDVAGAVALSDAAPPGPVRLAAIRDAARGSGAECLFAEPQFDPGLAAVVAEGTGLTIATLDPLGAALEPGPGLYPALLRGLAEAAATCHD